jgi:hypothetical protein
LRALPRALLKDTRSGPEYGSGVRLARPSRACRDLLHQEIPPLTLASGRPFRVAGGSILLSGIILLTGIVVEVRQKLRRQAVAPVTRKNLDVPFGSARAEIF